MGATGLVDCRVAVVVLERFGFLCFAILVGGKACWCCEALLEALWTMRRCRCDVLIDALAPWLSEALVIKLLILSTARSLVVGGFGA
jgi:hypothetical protein